MIVERTIKNFRPSETEKEVMIKTLASPTPKVADEELTKDNKLVASKRKLERLGYLTSDNDEVSVSDSGKQILRDLNLIDDSDEVTQRGQKYSFQDEDSGGEDTAGLGAEAPEPPTKGGFDTFESFRDHFYGSHELRSD